MNSQEANNRVEKILVTIEMLKSHVVVIGAWDNLPISGNLIF